MRNIDSELSLWGTIQQQTQTIFGSIFTPYLAILKFKISVFTHFGHIWSLKNLISSLNTVKLITFVMFIFKIPQNMEKIPLILYKKAKKCNKPCFTPQNGLLLVENIHLVQELWQNYAFWDGKSYNKLPLYIHH